MATKLATTAKSRTEELAAAIVEVLRQELTTPLALRLVRVGAIESLVSPDQFRDLVPGIYVRPAGTEYSPDVQFHTYGVTEAFRIAYAVPVRAEEDPAVVARAGMARILAALAADAGLSAIADDFAPDQITVGYPQAIEPDPPEDVYLDVDVPIKVIVCRWLVQWTTC